MHLIRPDAAHFSSYLAAVSEYRAHHVEKYHFLDPANVFTLAERFRTGVGLPEHYVKTDYLWLVEGREFLGEIAVRHSLTGSLLRYGGNIGYGVRYSHWGRGIGTQMLALALDYTRENLPLERVLITCDDDNIGSARVIEKNGGVLQDRIGNVIGGKAIITRRYWIEL